MPTQPSEIDYLLKQINEHLVGGKIISSVISDDKESFGIRVKMPNKTVKVGWIDMDAEGNGPGWISIEDVA